MLGLSLVGMGIGWVIGLSIRGAVSWTRQSPVERILLLLVLSFGGLLFGIGTALGGLADLLAMVKPFIPDL